VVGHEFMSFDDPLYVVGNPHVNAGLSLSSVTWAFTQFYAENWHPLTWVSHMLDVQVFGMNAGAHLLVNVSIHALSAALLFLALRAMTGALWPSAVVAAFFALHPLRAESVAWVSERKDVLGGFFFMLTLLAYARYTLAPSLARYAWVFVSLALGLMSKPMLVTLPPLLLLLDYWPLGRGRIGAGGVAEDSARRELAPRAWSQLVVEKLPLLVLVVVSSLITLAAQRGTISSVEVLGLPFRVANAAVSSIAYLWSALWPMRLAFFYPHPAIFSAELETPLLLLALLAGVALVAVTALALRERVRRPFLAVGWFWYLGMLVPVIGILQVGVQARADRYTYLPMIGVLVALVWGLREVAIARKISQQQLRLPVLILLGLYAMLGWVQVGTWQSRTTVTEHAIRVTDNNYVAHNQLGRALEELGRNDEARGHYEAALAAYPGFVEARTNLGNFYTRSGDLGRAEELQRLNIAAKPSDPRPYINLAVALAGQGRNQEAVEALKKALAADPNNVDAHYNLGVLSERAGRNAEAIEHYRSALRIRPNNPDARCSLAILLGKAGDLDAAGAELRQSIQHDPRHVRSLYNYAVVLVAEGDLVAAVDQLEQVLQVDPSHERARNSLQQLRASLE
jgi:tetratricopeptide (TPR) repeat protein